MNVILKKEDIDLLIKQLRKYGRTRDIDHYTVAIDMAKRAVLKHPKGYTMDIKLLGIVEGALYFKATNEIIYEVLKLLKIEAEE